MDVYLRSTNDHIYSAKKKNGSQVSGWTYITCAQKFQGVSFKNSVNIWAFVRKTCVFDVLPCNAW